KGSYFFWHCKYKMLIRSIGELGDARFYPVVSSQLTTGRADSGFTGVGNCLGFTTIRALVFMKAEFLSATEE
ncbi:MAG: hypothetical protein QME16_02200, partial [Planctomycetota bacterium]|nr:hypothetical protein [Planctomycetota bacterium]